MTFWQRKSQAPAPAPSRADVILAKKPSRAQSGPRSLIQVTIPRQESRRTHQRNEDRRMVDNLTAVANPSERPVSFPVLNLSSNGLMVDSGTDHARFDIGAVVPVAIGGCVPIPMAVRWLRGGRMGFEFLAETAIVSRSGVQDLVIDTINREYAGAGIAPGPAKVGGERREEAQRHSLMWLCQLSAGNDTAIARIRNISRTGALVSVADPLVLAPGGEVILGLEGAGHFRGTVKWRAEGEVGIALQDEFPLEMLASEPCVEVVDEPVQAPAQPKSREDALTIRYTGLSDPKAPPAMDYQPLTLRELYYTLYDGFDPARKG